MNKKVNEAIINFQEKYTNEFFNSLMAYEKIILIGKSNNGYITSKEVTKKKISREYIRLLEKKGAIEKVSRGIYILKNVIPDDFYIFQLRYPKTIFSHMTALYLYNLTEEIPYVFDITCVRNYNVKTMNENNIYYIDKSFLELGKTTVKTNYGNLVYVYNLERTICDIIKNSNRLDEEQVLKSLKKIIKNSNIKIDMLKLTDYSKKLKCHEKVMNSLRYYYE